MSPMRVALLDSVAPLLPQLLTDAGFMVTSEPHGAEVIVVRSGVRCDAAFITRLAEAGLRVIVRAGSGLDGIDLECSQALGIQVIPFVGVNAASVAEVALGYMFVMAHRLAEGHHSLRQGRMEKARLVGECLFACTLGIVGFGFTGQATARLAHAVGVSTIFYCRNTPDLIEEAPFQQTTLANCLQADIISLHVPLVAGTRHLINHQTIQSMRPGAILINMARRDVVDHDAVYMALINGQLGGYASDVLDVDQDASLLELPQVFATPHLGAQTKATQEHMATRIVAWLRDWLVQQGMTAAPSHT